MYKMKEVCDKVGLSYEALRFYCNEGLVPNVKRDDNNHRIFDEYDIKWIKGTLCLRDPVDEKDEPPLDSLEVRFH